MESMAVNKKNGYSNIIRSSSMIGGAQGFNIILGMVRVKFAALLIGPIGIGLLATYQSLTQVFSTVAGLGLHSSAVRDIAEFDQKKDREKTARIILSLRRICLLSGVVGAATVALMAKNISQYTFGSVQYTNEIMLLSLTVLFTNINSGQKAVIQGVRRVSDLAKLTIISAGAGTILSVILYFFAGVNGIIPSLVLLTLIDLLASRWFFKKIEFERVEVSWLESFREASGIVRLGMAFMWNALLIAIVMYITRTLIADKIDIIAVGVYSAAFSLSGMLVNFVLGAMAADYYPSLTGINNQHKKMCTLVNQQTEVGILLAMPGMLLMFVYAPWIVELFYSQEFVNSAELLRWFIIGCLGRVISWPLGYIVLAKGRSALFASIETLTNAIHLFLILYCLNRFDLVGVSMAYAILYVIYTLMMLLVSGKLIGFKWSKGVCLIGIISSFFIILSVLSVHIFNSTQIVIYGAVVVSFSVIYSMSTLSSRLGPNHKITRIYNRIFRRN